MEQTPPLFPCLFQPLSFQLAWERGASLPWLRLLLCAAIGARRPRPRRRAVKLHVACVQRGERPPCCPRACFGGLTKAVASGGLPSAVALLRLQAHISSTTHLTSHTRHMHHMQATIFAQTPANTHQLKPFHPSPFIPSPSNLQPPPEAPHTRHAHHT